MSTLINMKSDNEKSQKEVKIKSELSKTKNGEEMSTENLKEREQ